MAALYIAPVTPPAAENPTDDSHDWEHLGEQYVGADIGDPSWDPQPDDPTIPVERQPVPLDWRGLMRAIGIGRPSQHPSPTPQQLRVMDTMDRSDGSHAEFTTGAFAGPQGQEPTNTPQSNSWRAEPRPWDAYRAAS